MGGTVDSFFEFLFTFWAAVSDDVFIFESFMDVEPISELKNSGGIMFSVVGLDATLAVRDVIFDVINVF